MKQHLQKFLAYEQKLGAATEKSRKRALPAAGVTPGACPTCDSRVKLRTSSYSNSCLQPKLTHFTSPLVASPTAHRTHSLGSMVFLSTSRVSDYL